MAVLILLLYAGLAIVAIRSYLNNRRTNRTTTATEREWFIYFLYRKDLWWMFQGRINNGMLDNFPAEQWLERMQLFNDDSNYWSRINNEWKSMLKEVRK